MILFASRNCKIKVFTVGNTRIDNNSNNNNSNSSGNCRGVSEVIVVGVR